MYSVNYLLVHGASSSIFNTVSSLASYSAVIATQQCFAQSASISTNNTAVITDSAPSSNAIAATATQQSKKHKLGGR